MSGYSANITGTTSGFSSNTNVGFGLSTVSVDSSCPRLMGNFPNRLEKLQADTTSVSKIARQAHFQILLLFISTSKI
jgi:hypothetical protein